MISINSIKTFLSINIFLLSLGFFQYLSIQYFSKTNFTNRFFICFFIFIIRNYTLLNFIDSRTKNKIRISNDVENIPKEDYKYEFHYNIITATAVESLTHIFIKYDTTTISNNLYIELIYFIPTSFCFEIIYDFFHYFTHMLLHNKYLYKYLHKKHHKFIHPISITTFYQDPFDLLITNSIPTMLTLLLTPIPISYFQFNQILIYKTFIEISGHIGKKTYPICCFTQIIWLPKLLNIELYTEDHDLHHSLNNCNYSKRFTLWDKLFGTYKSSLSLSKTV